MQYWILYEAGVGGDGFACLLEHANNVHPADGISKWRHHYYEDSLGILKRPIRFYQAAWCTQSILPFRVKDAYMSADLNPVYTDLVSSKKNTVITAHTFLYKNEIELFKYKNIVQTDQVKIYLYSHRYQRVQDDLFKKRNTSYPSICMLERLINYNLKSGWFDVYIDIEQVWRDWKYLDRILKQLEIDLDQSHYNQYLTYIDNL